MTNSGQVIPPTEVDRLFQPFQRLGPRPARHGHGLGLSIVRTIATAHGATIGARALPGGGLAVDVTSFPRHPVPAPPLASSQGPAATAQAEYRPHRCDHRSAAQYRPLRSCRAMTTRWIWLVPS